MKNTRKALGAIAVGLMGAGVLGACAPAPAPPAGGAEDATVNTNLDCSLDIYDNGAFLFTSNSTYAVTVTIDGTNGNPASAAISVTGIENGPLPGAGGPYIEAVTSEGTSSQTDLLPAAGGGNIDHTGTMDVNGIDTTGGDVVLSVSGFNFYAAGTNPNPGDNDWAEGACTFPGGDPSLTLGA